MVPDQRKRAPEGFTLAAVLAVMGAMMLMAVAVLALVGIERKTARSYIDAKRAEWIAQAGMEEVRGLLREETANDDYLVIGRAEENRASVKDALEYLYLARGEGGGDSVNFDLFPLFSAEQESVRVGVLRDAPETEGLVGGEPAEFATLPWTDQARVAWLPVEDGDGRMVGRYGFWVEDLQGKLDGRQAGNEEDGGSHARVEWPFPAPGLATSGEFERTGVALFALDPTVVDDVDASTLDNRLIAGEGLLFSPESVLAAAGFEAPLARDAEGHLIDLEARALEEGVQAVGYGYYERPTVPRALGISEELAGKPKLNLNALLAKSPEQGVEDFAKQVEDGLPEFEDRKGGFPDDYVRTLAANALDYADADDEPRVEEGRHRGLDTYPLISEHLARFRWEGLPIEDKRKYLLLSGTIYAEFWNMSDKPVKGEVQVSYETNYSFDLGVVPDLNLGGAEFMDDPEVVTPTLEKKDGYYWLPPFELELQPNEYRLVACGTVSYKIDAGPSSVWVASPLTLGGDDEGQSGYRMKWNGVMVDQSRENVTRPDMQLYYPSDTKTRPRQGIWSTIPGHSYTRDRFNSQFRYANNMGDPRMAYYLKLRQDPNDYPDNYSPNRRTIRWGNIYQGDSPTKPKVYGRVMPSEWPDGGHNTAFGSLPAAVSAGRGGTRGDERISPDDAQFFKRLPEIEPGKAPMRQSSLGRFYSATELGNVYDPLMWEPTFEKSSDTKRLLDGYMPNGQASWPDVQQRSPASDAYGGGNTLRIGRPEHPRFEEPGLHAAHFLDLFHAGDGASEDREEREGALEPMVGRVNVNTASRDVLRALAAGMLRQDPELRRRASNSHRPTNLMAPPTSPLELGTPVVDKASDVIADAIIRGRPFACAAELAAVEDESGEPVFGNRELYALTDRIEWSDSAAEEVFARVYNSSTLRSRNFRVWVVGQAIAPLAKGSTAEPKVLAESRKQFTLFADPGERTAEGEIDEKSYRPMIIHENDF